ncbi:MAG TPA: OsmC family protein [Planctomycetota bacterium]|nr:OsmC family protein [Planctomycetota bacterium]
MVRIDIRYEGELRCTARHAPSGTTLFTDAPADNHGKAASFSPTDLLATSLGTCILTTMGIVAQRHGIDLVGASASVEKEMATSPVRRVGALTVAIHVPRDPGPEQRKLLENAAATCPVHASLHADVRHPVTFRWGA